MEGKHVGHEFIEYEKDPALKDRLTKLQCFKNRCQSMADNLQEAINDQKRHCDVSQVQLSQLYQESKSKILGELYKCFEKSSIRLEEETLKLKNASNDALKISQTQSEIFQSDYRKYTLEELSERYHSCLGSKNPEILMKVPKDSEANEAPK